MRRNILLVLLALVFSQSVLLSQNILPVYSSTNNRGFIENKGQIVDQNGNQNYNISSIYPSDGFNLLLRKDGFSYDIYEIENDISTQKLAGKYDLPENIIKKFHRIDVQFLNPDTGLKIMAINRTSSRNYYNQINYPDGILNVGVYDQVVYKNLYQGVDLIFYTDRSYGKVQLKYNFILKPGADINLLKLKYTGFPLVPITNKENQFTSIKFNLPKGNFTETIPSSWILDRDGNKGKVNVSYQDYGNGIIGFALGGNKNLNTYLTIDPVPVYTWGTYYGGSHDEFARYIKTDRKGNVYLCGYTYSLDCIATNGAFMSVFGGGSFDGFIAKLNPTGQRLWATYFGGNNNDDACSETFDSYGNLYIAGYTRSTSNITTSASHQPTFGGGYIDAFLAKFDTNGTRIWSTYIGGSGYDWGFTTIADENDNIFIAGRTTSINNMTTSGGYQLTPGGNSDVFIERFTTNGSRFWGTYLGGAGDDYGFSLGVDSNSYIYLAGHTNSTSGIAFGNAFQNYFGGGNMDAFLAKICTCGPIVWCTYYGGSDDDEGWSVISDNKGLIYLSGVTSSTNGISTPNSFQDTLHKNSDAFLAKFTDIGNRVWATYFGGDSTDGSLSVAYSNNNIYIAGYTCSTYLPLGKSDDTLHGSTDAFMASFDLMGKGQWSTYIGGQGYDEALSISADIFNNIYISGYTGSTSDIAAGATYQDTFGGGNFDVFVKKYRDPCYSYRAKVSYIKDAGCFGQNNGSAGVSIHAGTAPFSYLWSNGDSTALTKGLEAGKYNCRITDFFGCIDSISVNIKETGKLDIKIDKKNISCFGGNNGYIILNVDGGTKPFLYLWSNGDSNDNIENLKADTYNCIIRDSNFCTDTVIVDLTEPMKMQFSETLKEPACYHDTNGEISVNISGGTPPYHYKWDQGNTTDKITNLKSGTYNLWVTDSNNCKDSINMYLNQHDTLQILFQKSDDTGTCNGMAMAIVSGGTRSYNYIWNPGLYIDSAIYNLCKGVYYVTVTDSNGCKAIDSIQILRNNGIKSQFDKINLELYPNPANDYLVIDMKEHFTEMTITISDITGKIILTQSFNVFQRIQLYLYDLLPGIYFIRINTHKPYGQFDHKIIISK